MNWLRIVAWAFVGIVVLFGISLMIGYALENGKSYYGSYGATVREWAGNVAGCLILLGFMALFGAALMYAIQGRLW